MESQVLTVPRLLLTSLLVASLSGIPGAAAAMARDTKAPTIVHVKVLQTPRGKELLIRARFEDESEIFAPSVYYRRHGTEQFTTVEMSKADEGWAAIIPASEVVGPLEYFIEVFDAEGNGPAREGTPEQPIPIAVYEDKGPPTPPIGPAGGPPPPPPPGPPPPKLVVTDPPPPYDDDDGLATQWWFWTGIGVVVTGAIVGTILLTRGSDPVSEVSIEVIGPDPTARLP